MTVKKLPPAQRLEEARKHMKKVVDLLLDVIDIHEQNHHLIYARTVTKKIPRSHAASAYNILQHATHRFELLRLMALWEGAEEDKASIPSVITLIDDRDVLKQIGREIYGWHGNQHVRILDEPEDPEVKKLVRRAAQHHEKVFGGKQARKGGASVRGAITIAKNIIADRRLRALRHLRDKHIAHNLHSTRAEKTQTVETLKYGDETHLLEATIPLVENLYLWVNGTHFDIAEERRDRTRRDAAELWSNCSFSIPEQP